MIETFPLNLTCPKSLLSLTYTKTHTHTLSLSLSLSLYLKSLFLLPDPVCLYSFHFKNNLKWRKTEFYSPPSLPPPSLLLPLLLSLSPSLPPSHSLVIEIERNFKGEKATECLGRNARTDSDVLVCQEVVMLLFSVLVERIKVDGNVFSFVL